MRHTFGGHGTIRDDNNEKRRLHSFLFSYKVNDAGTRVPIVRWKEHDYYAPFEGHWRNDGSDLEVFKDINNLGRTLSRRTLMQTVYVKVEWTLIEERIKAIHSHLQTSKAMAGLNKDGIPFPAAVNDDAVEFPPSLVEIVLGSDGSEWFSGFLNEARSRWPKNDPDAATKPSAGPYTQCPLPCRRDAVSISNLAASILKVI